MHLGTGSECSVRFSGEKRGCLTDSDLELSYFPSEWGLGYSMTNCFLQTILERVLELCHCFPLHHWQQAKHILPQDVQPCTRDGLRCSRQIFRLVKNINYQTEERRVGKN